METTDRRGDTGGMTTTASVQSSAARPMNIRVQFFGRPRSAAFAQRVGDKLERALARFRDRIDEVRVRVRDVNAARGGEDQQCSLELCLVEGPRVHVEARAASPFAALQRLTSKARRLLQRRSRRRSS